MQFTNDHAIEKRFTGRERGTDRDAGSIEGCRGGGGGGGQPFFVEHFTKNHILQNFKKIKQHLCLIKVW